MSLTWYQFKTAVKSRLTDITPTDSLFAEACALYVKAQISREVDHDLLMAKSFNDSYRKRRLQLVGFTTSLTVGGTLDAEVAKFLPVDATREGITTYLTAQIKNAFQDIQSLNVLVDTLITEAVINLQTYLPSYRVGTETIYTSTNVVAVGNMSRGPTPPEATLLEAWWLEDVAVLTSGVALVMGSYIQSNGRTYLVVSDGTVTTIGAGLLTTDGSVETLDGVQFTFFYGEGCFRSPMLTLEWHDRYKMGYIKDNCCSKDKPALIAVDDEKFSFFTWPKLDATHRVSIFWNGIKVSFVDGDITPFDEGFVIASKEYVLSVLMAQVEEAIQLARLHAGAFADKRAQLYAECTRRGYTKY